MAVTRIYHSVLSMLRMAVTRILFCTEHAQNGCYQAGYYSVLSMLRMAVTRILYWESCKFKWSTPHH